MTSPSVSNPNAVAARFSMAGRRALVTGGSVSIGREIALAFAEAGADIAIQHAAAADAAFGRPDAAAEAVAQFIGLGVRAVAIEADFAQPGEAARTVRDAEAALGGVDVLVVCASVQQRTELERLDVASEEVRRQVQINFLATLELFQAALPAMQARGWGRVLTIGSINEARPEPDLSVYAALKSAQHNLSVNFAKVAARHGVLINTLSPGLIATERNRWRRRDEAAWAEIQRGYSPLGRAGTPREMAGAALLFCSDAGSYIAGADLLATGGGHLKF